VQDFDGGEIGSAVTQYFAAIHAKEQLSWRVQSANLFPNGPDGLAHAVVEEQCWVAIASASFFQQLPILRKQLFSSQSRDHRQTHSSGRYGQCDIQQQFCHDRFWKRSSKRKCIVSLSTFFDLAADLIIFFSSFLIMPHVRLRYLVKVITVSNASDPASTASTANIPTICKPKCSATCESYQPAGNTVSSSKYSDSTFRLYHR